MEENGQSARPTVALCLSILDFLGWFRRKKFIPFPRKILVQLTFGLNQKLEML
jgi:hypothetical protein